MFKYNARYIIQHNHIHTQWLGSPTVVELLGSNSMKVHAEFPSRPIFIRVSQLLHQKG